MDKLEYNELLQLVRENNLETVKARTELAEARAELAKFREEETKRDLEAAKGMVLDIILDIAEVVLGVILALVLTGIIYY